MIQESYLNLKKTIDNLGKPVKIVVASKTQSIETIKQLVECGQLVYGENKVQEAIDKWKQLPDLEWHFIGHLQSNKVKEVVSNCELIHSVDRMSLAKAINQAALNISKIQKILIQVNTSGEDNKSGVLPAEVINFIKELIKFENIQIMGFMTMAHQENTEELAKVSFNLLREIRDDINLNLKTQFNELSMGMSDDYKLAINYGATIIRPGRVIFGQR